MNTEFITPMLSKCSTERQKHYAKRYVKFIEYCRNKNLKSNLSCIERHHILPRSVWPMFSHQRINKWNIISLTHRQHYIAHWILARALGGSMWSAFHFMSHVNINKNRVKISSNAYSELKIKYSNYLSEINTGENNHFYGKTHTVETKKKLSEKAKINNKGSSNPMFGRTGTLSPLFGKKKSTAHLDKIKESLSNVDDVTCPHCGKSGKPMAIKRWHFDNCGKSIDKVGGHKNPRACRINIYNSSGELMFECNGDFTKICKDNNLPTNTLSKSYRKGGVKIYQNSPDYFLRKLTERNMLHLVGWYAIKL